MAGWGLVGSATANAPLDTLEELIAGQAMKDEAMRKQAIEQRKLSQDDQRIGIDAQRAGLEWQRVGLDRDKFVDTTSQRTQQQQRIARLIEVARKEQPWMVPVLEAQEAGLSTSPVNAETFELSPTAKHDRDVTDETTKASAAAAARAAQDKTNFGYDLAKIRETAANRAEPRTELTPNEAIRQTRQLRNDYVKETSAARQMSQQLGLMKQGIDAAKRGDMAAGSQAVLVTFQKILDPTSVVRESEYARSGSGLSLLTQMEGMAQKIAQGGAGVPVAELEKFASLADKFVQNQTRYATQTRKQLDSIADAYGLRKDLITNEIEPDDEQSSATTQPTAESKPTSVLGRLKSFIMPSRTPASVPSAGGLQRVVNPDGSVTYKRGG